MAAALGAVSGLDPELAIAASMAIVFMLVVLANLSLGLALFVFLAFLETLPSLGGPTLTFAKAAGLVLAISWVAAVSSRQEHRPGFLSEHPGLSLLLVLFLAWSAISTVWADSTSAAFTSTYRYALDAILLIIVFAAVRERRHLTWVVAAFVAGATVAALYGLVIGPSPSASAERVAGTIGDPNQLAAVLVAGAVLAAGLGAASSRDSLLRAVAVAATFLCLAALVLTVSRGGLFALVFTILVALPLAGRWRRRATVGALAVVFLIGAYLLLLAPFSVQSRLSTAGSGSGRTDIWTVGWREVEAHPVAGVGSGNFKTASIHYLLQPGPLERDEFIVDTPKVAHNVYLQILAELGVIGLVLFLCLIATSISAAVRAAREFALQGDRRMELLTRAVVIALAGLLVADFFISDQYSKQLWLLLGLGPALLAIAKRTTPDQRPAT